MKKFRFLYLAIMAAAVMLFAACDNAQTGAAPANPGSGPESDTTPPGPVTNFVVENQLTKARLNWTNPGDSDFAGVNITFSPIVSGITQPVNVSGEAVRMVNGKASHTIAGLPESIYTFTIRAVDASGNESSAVRAENVAIGSIDPNAPDPVTNLVVENKITAARLTWTNPNIPDLASINITFTPAAGTIYPTHKPRQ